MSDAINAALPEDNTSTAQQQHPVNRRMMQDLLCLVDQTKSRDLWQQRCVAAQSEAATLRAELEAAKQSEMKIVTASSIVLELDKAQLQEVAEQLRDATARVGRRDNTIAQQRTEMGQLRQQANTADAAAAEKDSDVQLLRAQVDSSRKALDEKTVALAKLQSQLTSTEAQFTQCQRRLKRMQQSLTGAADATGVFPTSSPAPLCMYPLGETGGWYLPATAALRRPAAAS